MTPPLRKPGRQWWLLLALLFVVPPLATLSQDAGPADAAKAKKAPTDGGTKGAQSSADAVLKALMAGRHVNVGKTARGQTIADAPPFTASKRTDKLDYFPCSQCHADQATNRTVRILKEEHTDIHFDHGGGRFWCYECHNADNMDTLRSFRGTPIDFNESYKLCGQCHFERQLDWYFGGHGKRVGAFPDPRAIPRTHDKLLVKDRDKIGHWRGPRKLLNCTVCHNPHSPAILPYKPSPAPLVRSGLAPEKVEPPLELKPWQRDAQKEGR